MPQWFLRWGIVALGSLVAGLVVGLLVLQDHRNRAQSEIEAAHGELELALATLSVRMASMATAIERASSLSPASFAQIYEDATRAATRVHERALAFMPEVATLDRATAVVESLAPEYEQAGYPAFEVFPPGQTDALFPVVLVEPPASRPNVFGYNMGSSSDRLAAAREALERGVMTTSAPVSLSQDADLSRASFLLLYPVYLRAPDPLSGATHAVLGAGMTPAGLFQDHVRFYDGHVLEIDIGIAGVDLPVTLGEGGSGWAPRIPIVHDFVLPDITTNGFEVPFRASVFYTPRPRDALWPILAAVLAALMGALILRVLTTREDTERALQAALARKEGELREAYRIQARSQRVEALGRLVGGVAHDFNNILSVILGNLELMKEEDATRTSAPLIEEAVTATHRGAHLTRQLLSVGRKSHLNPRRLSVADGLREGAQMLQRVLPESIELTTVPAAGLWPIEVDPDGLQNALLNLALNARDAMDGRGKLIVEATNTRATRDYLDDRPDEEIAPGRYVVISVTDTGPGMQPDVVDRAFEPFFTTKHATDGSGLGLPSVLGFCRQSGGTCRIYSEPGVGTTVRMYFPASEGEQGNAPTAGETTPLPVGTGRILLAEDEDSVARVILRQLQSGGYTVKRVPTGDAAWAEIEDGAQYDLLITDLVMPGTLQGAELARHVEAERPRMAILLISGYPQEAAIEGNGVATRHPVLTKPILRAELLQSVERLLRT